MLSARSDSLSVTLFFLPAMIHLPSTRDTLTAGAPHSSRGSRCANDIAWQITAKKAIRTTRLDGDIFSLAENEPLNLKPKTTTYSPTNHRLEKLTHAESVPRAVASEALSIGLLIEPRSLPLAVLIRRSITRATFQGAFTRPYSQLLADQQPGRTRRQIFDFQTAFAPAQV